MTVMSFANLKTKNHPEQERHPAPSPSGPATVVRNQGIRPSSSPGIMSFAHLKRPDTTRPAVVREEEKPAPRHRVFSIPSVMPTAKLAAVNYCQGCPRFIPTTDAEKPYGNPYGRCLRDGEIDSGHEVWKIITIGISVSSCYCFKQCR